MPFYMKGDQGINYKLMDVYRLKYAPFMKIKNGHLVINIKALDLE